MNLTYVMVFYLCRPSGNVNIKVNAFNPHASMPEEVVLSSSTVSLSGMASLQTTAEESGKSTKTFLEEQDSPSSDTATEASTQGYVTFFILNENNMH